jgi:misacylated tRNA(Ala) deacylase
MPTAPLFRDDAYLQETTAVVTAVTPEGGIVLNRTVFYAQGGGQPGDVGALRRADGEVIPIANAIYGADRADIVHVPAGGVHGLAPGDAVTALLDWPTRHRRMRMHTALHLLSVVLPHPVTGGAIGDGEGRLDFDIPDAGDLDREAANAKLAELIALDRAVAFRWITDAELDANPGLVKTMKVQPPRGSGKVRLVEIDGLDLQPCGGTHVRSTGEIGRVAIAKVEKKGKLNRRVRLTLG